MKVKATLTSKIKGKLYLLKLFIIFRSNKSSKLGAAEQMVLWSLYALARSCDAFDKNTLPLLLFSASAPRHCCSQLHPLVPCPQGRDKSKRSAKGLN
jgi:hypothetical protein